MKHSVISFSVVFLLLTQNIQDSKSEPTTLVTIGVISSVVTIGTFLWDLIERITQRGKSTNELDRENYSRNMDSYSRFAEENERMKAIDNFSKVDKLIMDIDKFYKDMVRYNESLVSHSFNGSYGKMKSEAEANLSNDSRRPIGLMRSIYQLLVSSSKHSIFKSLQRKFQEEYTETCSYENDIKSFQKYFLDYYLMHILSVEAKVYMIVRIASEILKTTTNENYSFDLEIIDEELAEMCTSIMETYRKLLKIATREVWRCDPSPHVEDVTYTELKNVFNLFIVNENHLAYNEECAHECGTLNPRSWNPCLDTELGVYCPGPLWECKSGFGVNHLYKLEICYLSPDSSRRYEYIDMVSSNRSLSKHYGSKSDCNNCQIRTEFLEYVSRYQICDVCICTSDHEKNYNKTDRKRTERFFYAKAVHVDVSNNYVMIGVRLVKKDGIVFFEVQQGKLSTQNSIESSSISWITIEPENLYNTSNLIKINWNRRSIELQDIDVPHGHFLVGLQIDVISDRIVLKVLSLPLVFMNGRVKLSDHHSVADITYSTSPTLSTTGLDLTNHDVPNPKVKSNKIVTDKYLIFSTSSFDNDLGQTTIPLLDIQNVTTTIPIPMAGAGFYFKYTGDYVGYLGIKLKMYDFMQHLAYRRKINL